MSKKFRFIVEIDDILDECQIWPDGGGPKVPTLKDVLEIIKRCAHSPSDLVEKWSLDIGALLRVIDIETKEVVEVLYSDF